MQAIPTPVNDGVGIPSHLPGTLILNGDVAEGKVGRPRLDNYCIDLTHLDV